MKEVIKNLFYKQFKVTTYKYYTLEGKVEIGQAKYFKPGDLPDIVPLEYEYKSAWHKEREETRWVSKWFLNKDSNKMISGAGIDPKTGKVYYHYMNDEWTVEKTLPKRKNTRYVVEEIVRYK